MAISSNFFANSLSSLGGIWCDPRTDQFANEYEVKRRFLEEMLRQQNQAASAPSVRVPMPDPSTNPILLLTGEDE